ncbi:NACHT domain-containing protein [Streptomyces sp. NBC_00234]|uniref:NACHT domain-containing protein n=1 Tax=Streptomyces sp. NBC_00234 TaxID=2903638 RepID=UPI002E28C75A|nr:NACHT domain-containing protein [Streptomyces sp. NBC_00234]
MRDVRPGDRTVVVLGAGSVQGSGVLLTDRLVLTCAHVVKGGSRGRVAHPGLAEHRDAAVSWIDHDLDAALLLTAEPVLPVPPVRLGALDSGQALRDCEITGFPDIQRYGSGGHLEADQYTATVLPMAGRVRSLMVCELDGPPPATDGHGAPALRGLSGGPVFAGSVLLGIARQIPRQRGGGRVECVALPLLAAARPVQLLYEQATGRPLRYEKVHGHHPRDQQYEADYAASVGAAYRRTKVFGLDELNRNETEWDLDTAYLSLEAQPPDDGAEHRPPPVPQRIDALLSDRPRVLLRGNAGAGKTTLIWWLAAHAAARTLPDRLDALNGLVPFVVPLRTLRARGGTFPGPAGLPAAARLVVDEPPEGWAGRVLESGRALLLVDGLDEVPREDRDEAHDWLSRLLERYPGTRCVATVRPLAVEPDWLRSQDFEELRLLPMRNEDIRSFVGAWHRAARLDSDDHEHLGELEQDLTHRFTQNTALLDLARTPLLCAVICALHRRRQGFLPETRWKLYRSALDMLLGNRDKRRRIDAPEGITMDVEEQTQLLQRIAVWLVREGQSEFSRAQALRQLDRALSGMERVRVQGTAEEILTHLLNRSGLLQERADDTYQFAHRTFQDFLAAKELIEDDHLNELLRHAAEEQWQDVILLAAGHCGRRELPFLVNGLLDAGLAVPEGSLARTELHVLAALCEQHAAWLDGAVRERVRRHTADLFPPRTFEDVAVLARLETAALGLLPAPADLPEDSDTPFDVARLISAIGGAEAVPYARKWAETHPSTNPVFARTWSCYPTELYAREVLDRIDPRYPAVTVSTADHLAALHHAPSLAFVELLGPFTDADLQASLRGVSPVHLLITSNPELTDLAFLGICGKRLTDLTVKGCPRIASLASLAGLAALRRLTLDTRFLPGRALEALSSLTELRSLTLSPTSADRLGDLPAHPRVPALRIWPDRPFAMEGLEAWTGLTSLGLHTGFPSTGLSAALRASPGITDLDLSTPALNQLLMGEALPHITGLGFHSLHSSEVEAIVRTFPALSSLRVRLGARRPEPLDLSPLRALPGCRVTVDDAYSEIVGTEGIDLTL